MKSLVADVRLQGIVCEIENQWLQFHANKITITSSGVFEFSGEVLICYMY